MEQSVKAYKSEFEFYEKIDRKKRDDGDVLGRVVLWHTAKKYCQDARVFKFLSEAYRDAELYDLSVRFLYRYIDRVKDKTERVEAFIELGNCYFFLDNVKVSNYYFNRAFLLGGMIDQDLLAPEVSEYFSAKEEPEEKYVLVYPPECVDYNDDLDDAKDYLIAGMDEKAMEIYEKIPPNSPFYAEARTEMSVTEFLHGNTEKGIEFAKKSLRADPKNVQAACNLASMYFVKREDAVSRSYYERALSMLSENPENDDDTLKVAMAACEQREHQTAIGLFSKLLGKKPLDPNLLYLRALAYLNLGELKNAREGFSTALAVRGRDALYEYFVRFTDSEIEKGRFGIKNDFTYFQQLPEEEEKRIEKRLRMLIECPVDRIEQALNEKETQDFFLWAFSYGDADVQKLCAYILGSVFSKYSMRALKTALLEVTLGDYLKHVLLTILTVNHVSGHIGMVVGNVYQETRMVELPATAEKRYLYSYAGAVAALAPLGVDDMGRLERATESVQKRLPSDAIMKNEGNVLSAVITVVAGYADFADVPAVSKLFHADVKRVNAVLTEYYKSFGENQNEDTRQR